MFVKAAPGLKVPREDDPRQFIDETTAVEMPASHYYLRRLAEGELVEAKAPKPGKGEDKPLG